MSRQARLILILSGIAVVGVLALGVIAQRFSGAIAERQAGGTHSVEQAARAAQGQVDAFIRVRMALRERIDAADFDGVEPEARVLKFVVVRKAALTSSRLDIADYRELRQRYREWKREPTTLATVWHGAFAARDREIEACDLGEFEILDR